MLPRCERRRWTVAISRLRDRLQEVVRRPALESLDRVLVVRGHEHHLRVRMTSASAAAVATFEACQPRHADVQERDVRAVLADCLQRARPVLAVDDDLEVRPLLPELSSSAARELFVFGDHAGAGASIQSAFLLPSAIKVIVAATPAGKLAATASAAFGPYTRARRSRRFLKPMPVPWSAC